MTIPSRSSSSAADEFWGDQAEWPDAGPTRRRRPGFGASMSRWWNGVLDGGAAGGRQHGRPDVDPADEWFAEPADDDWNRLGSDSADEWRDSTSPRVGLRNAVHDGTAVADVAPIIDVSDAEMLVEAPTKRPPAIDPLLARLGAATVVAVLAIPLIAGVGRGADDAALPADATAVVDTVVSTVAVAAVAAASSDVVTLPTTPATSAPAAPGPTATTAPPEPPAPASSAVTTATAATTAPTAQVAAAMTQLCAVEYEVVAGDYWIRVADASGTSVDRLLDANDASASTPLYPGATICLPEGASIPAPPPTPAPETRPSPAATVRSTTPTTTNAPVQRPATTTTTTAPIRQYSPDEVQQLIRDIWPDDLEDRAIEIADRESNFVPTARNSCCHGVFQMHYNAHRSWLSAVGVTSTAQLYDAPTNIRVAYTLYQRSGGWGPWT